MGNQVRHYRKLKKLTQQQVADALGMHLTNYNRIERGHSAPDVSRFEQIARILNTTTAELLADDIRELRRVSDEEEYEEELRAAAEQAHERAYDPDSYRPKIPGAVPELSGSAGAGEGKEGENFVLPLGGESYSGHAIVDEWLFPEYYLRSELGASIAKTIVMPVVGDSMEPTYRPGDRVLIDLTQKSLTEDTVYVISDGESPPRIKRLVLVLKSKPKLVRVVSDNPAISDQELPLSDITIIGRVVGKVSRA